MKTLFGGLVMAALLVGAPLVAEADPQPRGADDAATPLVKMTKAEKVAAFSEMAQTLGRVPRSCRLKGKRLWGKVKIVSSFPHFKVKIVSSFPDLKVKWVSSFPDKCGKWKKVRSFPNFKVKWVRSFPDFKIKIVRSFPGVR